MKNIALVGFMSCGKSTIGQLIAKHFNINFADTDKIITDLYKMSIIDIFNNFGQDFFIDEEFNAISNLININAIISVGGAAFIRQKTFDLIKNNFTSIYLKISPLEIYNRLLVNNNYKSRPNIIKIFENKEKDLVISDISKMLQQREIWYNKADIVVEIPDNTGLQQVTENIIILLNDLH